MSKKFHGGTVISEKRDLILTRPLNTQDTNYRLINTSTRATHLIDIDDVHNDCNLEDLEEYGGILFSELVKLEDVDSILELVWKSYGY